MPILACELFPIQLFTHTMCKAKNKMHCYLKYQVSLLLLIPVLKFKKFVCLGFQLNYKDHYQ